MKAIKQIFALLIAVVMVVAMVPAVNAFALEWEEQLTKYDLVFSAGAGNGGSDTWTYLLNEAADLPDAGTLCVQRVLLHRMEDKRENLSVRRAL